MAFFKPRNDLLPKLSGELYRKLHDVIVRRLAQYNIMRKIDEFGGMHGHVLINLVLKRLGGWTPLPETFVIPNF